MMTVLRVYGPTNAAVCEGKHACGPSPILPKTVPVLPGLICEMRAQPLPHLLHVPFLHACFIAASFAAASCTVTD